MTVSEFIDDYLFRARHQSFPVTRDGTDTVCGLVTLDRIKHIHQQRLAEAKDQRGHRGGEHPPPALHHQHVHLHPSVPAT